MLPLAVCALAVMVPPTLGLAESNPPGACATAPFACDASPAATASITPTTSASGGPTPSPPPTPVKPSPSASVTAPPGPGRAAPHLALPGAGDISLSAATMTVTGLVYTGSKTITSFAGPMTVLEFTAASATLTALAMSHPCQDGYQWVQASPSAAMVNLTLELTVLQATIGGTTVTLTPAAPPSAPLLPGGAGTLDAISAQGPQLGADSFIGVLAGHVAAC